ncbi:TIGR01777 family oxidoreductase [bacterium]|nr:TIGR01777 family oxidoreductase [bacterium]
MMKILLTGASGLIGSALWNFLTKTGHEITRLVRSKLNGQGDEIYWEPNSGILDKTKVEGFEAVVHLAGENIASRWTEETKARIRDSRLNGTRLLRKTLNELERPPKVLVCASAIGYYGNRGAEVLTEDSEAGTGFLVELCREWEATSVAVGPKGIRLINLRIGVVLSDRGGALQKMLTPFKMGVGGIVGDGTQFWSWIAIDDVVGAIHHALVTESLQGPVNAVSPNPVDNRDFTKTLGRILGRPTIFPMPAFAARLAFGEMADELLLASARVKPAKLLASKYEFRFPELADALQHVLGKD